MSLTWREVVPLAQAVYDRHAVGCCAHILLDDDNVQDHHAQSCLDFAREQGHADCIALCEKLVLLSRTQRLKLGNYDHLRAGGATP